MVFLIVDWLHEISSGPALLMTNFVIKLLQTEEKASEREVSIALCFGVVFPETKLSCLVVQTGNSCLD